MVGVQMLLLLLLLLLLLYKNLAKIRACFFQIHVKCL